jgi:hypothetical protein
MESSARTAGAVPLAADSHIVHFYEHSSALTDDVVVFLADGFDAGHPAAVIAAEEHLTLIADKLRARGFDPDALVQQDRLVLLDAHETLQSLMLVHSPSPQRFNVVVGGVIARLSRLNGNAAVRAYGEMVDVLWRAGNTVGALRLEELWNDLTRTHDFRLFCAYSMGHFIKASSIDSLTAICERHSHVRPIPSCADGDSPERRVEVAALQERVMQLEQSLREREQRERDLQASLRRLAVTRHPGDSIPPT